MTTHRVLFVGLPESERSWLKSWCTTQGFRAWFAQNALAALRVFDEFEATRVVIDTLLDDSDALRLAQILQAASPALDIVFLGNQSVESAYYDAAPGLTNAAFAHRPLEPEALVGVQAEPSTFAPGLIDRGSVDAVGLARVLFRCLEHRTTGTLYLGDAGQRRVVHLRDGAPVYVESRIASENFGRLLVEWGLATRVEIDWAQSMQLSEGIRQGEALVKIGVLDEDKVVGYLHRQYVTKLTRAFTSEPIAYRLDSSTAGGRLQGESVNILHTAIEGLQHCGAAGPEAWAEHSETPFVLAPPIPESAQPTIHEVVPPSLRTRLSRPTTLEQLTQHGFDPEWLIALFLTLRAAGYAQTVPGSSQHAA